MIHDNEIVTLVLAAGVLVFMVSNYRRLQRYRFAGRLITGFGFYFFGCLCTILEGITLEGPLNLIEHLSYCASALCVAAWVAGTAIFPPEERGCIR